MIVYLMGNIVTLSELHLFSLLLYIYVHWVGMTFMLTMFILCLIFM